MTLRTLLLSACLLAAPLSALAEHRDLVAADSFGNLVIWSASGYKRILVGQGEFADAYNATGSYYGPVDVPSHTPSAIHAPSCDDEVVILRGEDHLEAYRAGARYELACGG